MKQYLRASSNLFFSFPPPPPGPLLNKILPPYQEDRYSVCHNTYKNATEQISLSGRASDFFGADWSKGCWKMLELQRLYSVEWGDKMITNGE
jgi:hypothetical protein